MSGWTIEELRNEIERFEFRINTNIVDDTSSIIKELHDELKFRERYRIYSLERFLESGDAR